MGGVGGKKKKKKTNTLNTSIFPMSFATRSSLSQRNTEELSSSQRGTLSPYFSPSPNVLPEDLFIALLIPICLAIVLPVFLKFSPCASFFKCELRQGSPAHPAGLLRWLGVLCFPGVASERLSSKNSPLPWAFLPAWAVTHRTQVDP